MTLGAFGKTVGSPGPSWGAIHLYDAFDSSLALAVMPTTGSGPYELLSGTILQTHLRTDSLPTSAVVSPGLITGELLLCIRAAV